ncbi:haloacid dehalogenase-like hydrolase domain-containing protein Sgpp isoform X1 [Ipomoea triloba]|uniref:haloacid dehalogenase-like hydrolase domain-containing protein Sgpp isoform X1 n=1 Tax=Ipomoea triloba TaxID=35885 RepID=UPI00125E3CD1|nr:haloacid dehalogenase-like hydrolase domain-containing protein Sgpp isoform X1 [Ipomoea triloba]
MSTNVENSVGRSLCDLAPLEAILFDIDGTLCDSDPIHLIAFRQVLQQMGYNGGEAIDEEFYMKYINGKHNEEIVSSIFPGDPERGIKLVDDKEALYRRLAKDKLKPIEGLHQLRKWIEDHGLKTAAVTNAPRPNADLMIEVLGLSDFFDAIIIGPECEHPKPYPHPYLKALQVLKVSKDHTFIFEDSVSGIKAGVAAGMSVVGLTTQNPAHLLMEADPIFLIKDFADPKLWAALGDFDKNVA